MRTIAIHRLRGKGGKEVAPNKPFDPKDLGIGKEELDKLASRGAIRIEEDEKTSTS